jgi:hypothetical protein
VVWIDSAAARRIADAQSVKLPADARTRFFDGTSRLMVLRSPSAHCARLRRLLASLGAALARPL